MLTEEELNQVAEKVLLKIPAVIGNLMANQAVITKLSQDFYKNHPEFESNKAAVASVVEKVESENPGMTYDKVLNLSIPLIRERLKVTSKLNLTDHNKPSRKLNIDLSGNGEL